MPHAFYVILQPLPAHPDLDLGQVVGRPAIHRPDQMLALGRVADFVRGHHQRYGCGSCDATFTSPELAEKHIAKRHAPPPGRTSKGPDKTPQAPPPEEAPAPAAVADEPAPGGKEEETHEPAPEQAPDA